MGEAVNAFSRFNSVPALGLVEDRMAKQVGKTVEKSVTQMSEDEGRDKIGAALVEAQTMASADAIRHVGPQVFNTITLERWDEIEGKLRTAFEDGMATMKERLVR